MRQRNGKQTDKGTAKNKEQIQRNRNKKEKIVIKERNVITKKSEKTKHEEENERKKYK